MEQKKLTSLTKDGWRKPAKYNFSTSGKLKKYDKSHMKFKQWKAKGFK